jgi:hypothetical protein
VLDRWRFLYNIVRASISLSFDSLAYNDDFLGTTQLAVEMFNLILQSEHISPVQTLQYCLNSMEILNRNGATRKRSILRDLHNPYAISSNNLSMLCINILLPQRCCMKNRRLSRRQHIMLQPCSASFLGWKLYWRKSSWLIDSAVPKNGMCPCGTLSIISTSNWVVKH